MITLMKSLLYSRFSKCLLVLALPVLVSCDDESPNGGSSKVPFPDGTSWRLTAATTSPERTIEGQTSSDLYAILPACTKDDIFIRSATEDSPVLAMDLGSDLCNNLFSGVVADMLLFNHNGDDVFTVSSSVPPQQALYGTTVVGDQTWKLTSSSDRRRRFELEISDRGQRYTMELTFTRI